MGASQSGRPFYFCKEDAPPSGDAYFVCSYARQPIPEAHSATRPPVRCRDAFHAKTGTYAIDSMERKMHTTACRDIV
jgi:hypothetical protein